MAKFLRYFFCLQAVRTPSFRRHFNGISTVFPVEMPKNGCETVGVKSENGGINQHVALFFAFLCTLLKK